MVVCECSWSLLDTQEEDDESQVSEEKVKYGRSPWPGEEEDGCALKYCTFRVLGVYFRDECDV